MSSISLRPTHSVHYSERHYDAFSWQSGPGEFKPNLWRTGLCGWRLRQNSTCVPWARRSANGVSNNFVRLKTWPLIWARGAIRSFPGLSAGRAIPRPPHSICWRKLSMLRRQSSTARPRASSIAARGKRKSDSIECLRRSRTQFKLPVSPRGSLLLLSGTSTRRNL